MIIFKCFVSWYIYLAFTFTISFAGIGYETALGLAKRNARVILACRNMEQASKSCKRMQYESGNTDITVKQVDMSLMKSVRQLAEKILQEEKRLDILINNAAVIGTIYFKRLFLLSLLLFGFVIKFITFKDFIA